MAAPAWAINGVDLAMLSSGGSAGDDWELSENGYVGTYIELSEPGDVEIAVEAAGLAGGGVNPHMNIVVADTKAGFDVGAGFNTYQHTFSLPAGTHFVRTEFNNDVPTASRELTIRSLGVTGAAILNDDGDDNALAAADTYIQNYRRGPAAVQLVGATPGTEVAVRLKRHAFNFGTAVGGSSGINTYLGTSGTTAANFPTGADRHPDQCPRPGECRQMAEQRQFCHQR